jgi:hypothetical protein
MKLIKLFTGIVFFGALINSCDNGSPLDSGNTYTVSIGSLTNGEITADPASGTEGTEITLTVMPESGYQLKSGTLKYGSTSIDEAAKKFNLPASDVTITAEFERQNQNYVLTGTTWVGRGNPHVDGSDRPATGTLTFTDSNFQLLVNCDDDTPSPGLNGPYTIFGSTIDFGALGQVTITGNIIVFASFTLTKPSKFEGTWTQVSGLPGNLQIIVTGNTYLVKEAVGPKLKRCGFTFTETLWTETIIDDFNDGSTHGTVTNVTYTLTGDVLTINDGQQVFNRGP